MDAHNLIHKLQKRGVSLWVEKGILRFRGPKEVLDEAILQILQNKKQDIILALEYGNCNNCQHIEHIDHIGNGCQHIIQGEFSTEWTLLNTLEKCPRSYWH